MSPKTIQESKILQAYADKTPGSARLYARSRELFPSGVTHVGRYLRPHPVYISHAEGSRKWDVDGNVYVDYFGGHGALILGHSYPAVVEAVTRQVARGTHYGASHELELEWGSLIREMVPSAERVRFTNSGTEATLLGLRLARAATGKPAVMRFSGHFHGWHDHVASTTGDVPPGILPEIMRQMVVCPSGDAAAAAELLRTRKDIGAVILEPTGATFGQVPIGPEFLRELRRLTTEQGILLIFDEVITGFRCSNGGAQAYFGITPDLCTLAKIVAGGYPGGVLAGRRDLLDILGFQEGPDGVLPPRIPHQGTFNGGPVSASAGVATLKVLQSLPVLEHANQTAGAIRAGMNEALRKRGSSWCMYGSFSGFHLFTNPARRAVGPEDIESGKVPAGELKGSTPMGLQHKFRAGMLAHGVDLVSWPGGLVSGVHTADDVDRTLTAFAAVLEMLAEEGDFR